MKIKDDNINIKKIIKFFKSIVYSKEISKYNKIKWEQMLVLGVKVK